MEKIVLLLCTIPFLIACERKMFGVPEDQWHRLTPEQQQQIIEGYNEREEVRTKNEPVLRAVNTADFLVRNSKPYSPQRQW